jgi:short-subunit dehydrogenase
MRKTILITGASSGLGVGMAREFAARGRDLALCARRVDRLEVLKRDLLSLHEGIRVSIKALDVNDHERVFAVFRELAAELGGIDRVVVNAGVGKGRPIGTGNFFRVNLQTAQTNFVAALAQCEAAVELFREQKGGHLVVISSMSAMRGLPRNLTTYAATKAGVAALAEGIRADLMKTPIKVTTIFPGYIRSEINEKARKAPFMVDTKTGCQALAAAIEREPAQAIVPAWPWRPIGVLLRYLPLSGVAKMGKRG